MNLRCTVNFQEFEISKNTYTSPIIKNAPFIKKQFLVREQSLLKKPSTKIDLIPFPVQNPCKILKLPQAYQSKNNKKTPKCIKCVLTNKISSDPIIFPIVPKPSPRGIRLVLVQKSSFFIQEDLYRYLLAECESCKTRLNKLKNDISIFKKNVALKEKNLQSLTQNQVLKKSIPALDELERSKNININQIKSKKIRKFMVAYCTNLQMVYDSVIKNLGLTVIMPSVGEMFNEKYHTIIGIMYNKNKENKSLLEVIKAGYMLNNEVIDPAQVVVSTTNPNHPNIISKQL
jgi:molecular chaperone GrpE (heat shock protein)